MPGHNGSGVNVGAGLLRRSRSKVRAGGLQLELRS